MSDWTAPESAAKAMEKWHDTYGGFGLRPDERESLVRAFAEYGADTLVEFAAMARSAIWRDEARDRAARLRPPQEEE